MGSGFTSRRRNGAGGHVSPFPPRRRVNSLQRGFVVYAAEEDQLKQRENERRHHEQRLPGLSPRSRCLAE